MEPSKRGARLRAWGQCVALCILLAGLAKADGTAAPIITTVAGGGGSTSDGVLPGSAYIAPTGVAVDASGTLYFVDGLRVRKLGADGLVVTAAGDGTQMYDGDDQPAIDAALDPRGIAVDAGGNLYITDGVNRRVRKVTPDGTITTIAGSGSGTYGGDGGNALAAGLAFPTAVAVDASGCVYIVDSSRVRKIVQGGDITLVAGNGDYQFAGEGGSPLDTGMDPQALAVGASSALYIGDQSNNRIYRVADGVIRTIAGGGPYRSDPFATNVRLFTPNGVALDAVGNVYFTEDNNLVRMVTPQGVIQVVAGTFNDTDSGNAGGVLGFSGDGGAADQASLRHPKGIALDAAGDVLFADNGNQRIRKVTPVSAAPVPAGADAFAPLRSYPLDSQPQAVAIGDVTGDGRDDVLMTTAGHDAGGTSSIDYKVLLFVQRSDGTLAMPLAYDAPAGQVTAGLAVGDLNHDGYADAVVGLTTGIGIYLGGPAGLSPGTAVPGLSGSETPMEAVVLDIDGDGNLDVAATTNSSTGGAGATLGTSLFYGNGHGGIARSALIPSQPGDGTGLTAVDINRDRRPDLVTTWATDAQTGGVQIRMNDGAGGFRAPTRLASPSYAYASAVTAGDFDGDGRIDLVSSRNTFAPDAGVALFRQASNGQVSFAKAWATYDFPNALLASDVNGDGFSDLLMLHQGVPALSYQKQVAGSLAPAVKYYRPAMANEQTMSASGDLDSDGCPDVAISAPAYQLGVLGGRRCIDLRPGTTTVTGDFNGDGLADLLWRHARTGAAAIWRSANSAQPQSITGVTTPAWKIVAVGDFDGDHVSDIFWRNIRTGHDTVWRSGKSTTSMTVRDVTDVAWQVVGAADFDGDGRADVLWRNTRTGANTIWRAANGASSMSVTGVTNPEWEIVGLGDFDGDHHADILWRNAVAGANVIWKTANAGTSLAMRAVTDHAWRIVGVGDFDGDGRADILWRHMVTGANTIWRSGNGTTSLPVTGVTNLAWQVAGVGDFDGDRKADVMWRNYDTGADVIWRSANGTALRSVNGVTDLAWKLSPANVPMN